MKSSIIPVIFALFFSGVARATDWIPFRNCNQGQIIVYSLPGEVLPSERVLLLTRDSDSAPYRIQTGHFTRASDRWTFSAPDLSLTILSNGKSYATFHGNGDTVEEDCRDATGLPGPSGFSAGN